MSDEVQPGEARALATRVEAEVAKLVQGQGHAVQSMLVALIAGGHVLLEGVPGVAKTLLARSVAAAVQCTFSRIQFTPDLMPSDLTGVNVYEPKTAEFRLRKGPLFADLVLADEINRAPAKTQAALLEAMQEAQLSLDGETHALSAIFTVVATQNPLEYEGTYPLPEAQLDRFLLKVVMDYPSEAEERAMLKTMHSLGERSLRPSQAIQAVATPALLAAARREAHAVRVDDAVLDYILRLARSSRSFRSFALGASPRAACMLMQAAKALALLRGRDYLSPDEVQAMAPPVLRHRIRLTPEAELDGLTPDACITALVTQVAIPR